jgi:hypothetical protein
MSYFLESFSRSPLTRKTATLLERPDPPDHKESNLGDNAGFAIGMSPC